MAYAVQATTYLQTYPERPPGADLSPKKVCNLGDDALRRFEEAKALMRRTIPVARRVLGEGRDLTLKIRWHYAAALYKDDDATLDDLREAVTTLEDAGRTTRRIFGSAHPLTETIELHLRTSRDALHSREGDDVSSVCDAVTAMTPGGA